jgi:predicted TIM-barrel fold metal-dependent hydrolase
VHSVTTTVIQPPETAEESPATEVLISSDSHVLEPRDLWTTRLPVALRDRAPRLPERGNDHPGGTDPRDRLGVMQRDTVSAEVLFPTYGLGLYALEDAELQEACFAVYNDWLVEYCAGTPGRLIGLPAISTYNIDHAVKELERTAKLGLKGALLWYVPHPDLHYNTDHYERFWAAAQDMDMPVNLHILSGFSYNARPESRKGVEQYRGSVGIKLGDAINVLFDFVFYGVLERYPRLKLVIAEAELGWMPWLFQQWDYYVKRFAKSNPLSGSLLPSEYFQRQVYVTFFNDPVGAKAFTWGWGLDNAMWSNDFPHGNSTWPHSRDIIARDVAHLPASTRAKLLRENVARLYQFPIPSPIQEV